MNLIRPDDSGAVTAEQVLEIRDLTVSLPLTGDRPNAVENVSIGVKRGEILCVVGESGSGKSVIAFSIMGLLAAALKTTSGSIRLEGQDLVAVSAAQRRALRGNRMSMIFQEPMTALNPVVSVGKQIAEVLQVHTGMDRAERDRRVIEVMRDVNLPNPEQMIRSYPHQLSGGQRQRVMIAAALALEPVLLIADEPTTALDVTTQAQILRQIKELRDRRGMAVVFITHDFGVVAEIADRVAVMQRGRIVEVGDAHTVLRRPSHDYTRMLISSVPSLRPKPQRPLCDSAPVLAARDVSKTYQPASPFGRREPIVAVRNATIDIRPGEVLGLVGESGSGKSTLARCIVRLLEPSSGTIRIGDHEIADVYGEDLRHERQRVQIVFQDPYRSLNPRRTVGQSIVECPMNFGISREDAWKRASELMSFVGLDPRALNRYPHEFSGGQRQRICIARALAIRPRLLIADEAVSALDVSVQEQVLELLDSIRRRFELAILFITHDLCVAAQICDRIAVMHRGQVVEEGVTVDVFNEPQHSYTRQLLESVPGRNFQFGDIPAA